MYLTPALNPSTHCITLKEEDSSRLPNVTYCYHLRSLHDHADDIHRWTQFCASIFSYKASPPPPEYFARHFYNDPRRDASLVRVLIHCPNNDENEKMNGEIVSSVRIFRRTLSTGNASATIIEAGGIGEVCTSPNHQRRGLSKILLNDAIHIMVSSSSLSSTCCDNKSISCSLLHANPEFRPVYNKIGGYESVTSKWTLVPIKLNKLIIKTTHHGNNNTKKWSTRQAIFPQDVSQLQSLHTEYSEKRFITIIRSTEYWTDYVSAELGDSLWVLQEEESNGGGGEAKIVAWLSIRERGDRYQLREFGVDRNKHITEYALKTLLGVAVQQRIGDEDLHSDADGDKTLSFLLPTIVLSDIQQDKLNRVTNDDDIERIINQNDDDYSFFDENDIVDENDDGWMYAVFDTNCPNVLELTLRERDPVPHLIWPTDSF